MSNIKQPAPEQPKNPANDGIVSKPAEELVDLSLRVKTQSEIDSEMTLIRLQAEKLRLEKETLELEKLRKDVLDIRREQEQAKVSRETVQESLEYERNTTITNETYCTHMKGGDSGKMMHGAPAQGNDASNYALIQHTLTTGITFRMCLRCGKTWFPKDHDYRWAMTRPTWNSPSTGSPSPGLVRFGSKVQVKSNLPHKSPEDLEANVPGIPSYPDR
jgi:hypothetical protein